jgi:histidinol-phosphatase (PHP family)
MRMFPEQLTEYAQTVLALRDKYKGKLQIPLGVEAEYYPSFFPALVSRLRDAGIEYMLLGQHWCGDEIGQPYNGAPTAEEGRLVQYCDQLIEAINTGLFTYVAHPGLLHFVGEPKLYEAHMRRVCREAKACGIPLEINLLGLRENRHYPNLRVWAAAAEEDCPVVLGCDSHMPAHAVDIPSEKKALEIVEQFGLRLIEAPKIVRI